MKDKSDKHNTRAAREIWELQRGGFVACQHEDLARGTREGQANYHSTVVRSTAQQQQQQQQQHIHTHPNEEGMQGQGYFLAR